VQDTYHAEFRLEPEDNDRLAWLCGPFDETLHEIERRLRITVRHRGHVFRLSGAEAEVVAAMRLLQELYEQAARGPIGREALHLLLLTATRGEPEQRGGGPRDARPGDAETAEAVIAADGVEAVTTGIEARAPAARAEVTGLADPRMEEAGPLPNTHVERRQGTRRTVPRSEGLDDAEGPGGGGAAPAASNWGSASGIRTRRGNVRPRGANQASYLAAILEHDVSFGVGPAGTGKTYLAVAAAVEALESERVRRLVLTRPAVEAGERLGFLPGDLAQKVDPYLRPLYDALFEMIGFDRVGKLMERGTIEVAPLAFMRGRTLNESFIILDEAQNTTAEQMKMFLTRIGFGSRAVITGDITQIDLPRTQVSGLRQAVELLPGTEGIHFTFFSAADVVRHPVVARILNAYAAAEGDGAGA